MYTGAMPVQHVDPRVQRSRAALEAALLDLVGERDLAQISISDVTKHAGVNRSTFYEHYTDMHDLAESACTAMFDELVGATPVFGLPSESDQPQHQIPELFAHIAAHARLYRMLLGPDGSARVINYLLQRIAVAAHVGLVAPAVSTHADDPAEIPHDPQAAFTAGAVLGTVIDWLNRGCPGTPHQMADATAPLLVSTASTAGPVKRVRAGGTNQPIVSSSQRSSRRR
jgi:AcrR family transcriptional regulator